MQNSQFSIWENSNRGNRMIDNEIEERMKQMMQPIDQQLFLCEDVADELMLACAMLQRVCEIFDSHLGEEGRKKMFKEQT